MDSLIYLDANATTRPLDAALREMNRVSRSGFANPGSTHAPGDDAKHVLAESRGTIAEMIDADESEIIFTSGGTESINMALIGYARRYIADGNAPGTIALQQGDHPASAMCAEYLQSHDWQVNRFGVADHGRFDAGELNDCDWQPGDILTILLAHNETGVLQDPEAIRCLAQRLREAGVWTHIDAVQAIGKIDVSFRELAADSMSIASHKFYGPRGIGTLIVRDHSRLEPLLFGGGQEQGARPGTECGPLIAGMTEAMVNLFADQGRQSRVSNLRDGFETQLEAMCAERSIRVEIHGRNVPRLPNTTFVSFIGIQAQSLVNRFAARGVCCSSGAACKSSATGGSEILLAMNSQADAETGAVRFSIPMFGCDGTELQTALERIGSIMDTLHE